MTDASFLIKQALIARERKELRMTEEKKLALIAELLNDDTVSFYDHLEDRWPLTKNGKRPSASQVSNAMNVVIEANGLGELVLTSYTTESGAFLVKNIADDNTDDTDDTDDDTADDDTDDDTDEN